MKPTSSENHLLADTCSSFLILLPVAMASLILYWCCQPLKSILKSMCERRRARQSGSLPEINVEGDPALVLLASGRVVVLDRPRRIPTISLPGDFTSLDLSLGHGDTSSHGSKDNLQSPTQDYLPPPSYESIFGQPPPEPPSYSEVMSNNLTVFPLPESAV